MFDNSFSRPDGILLVDSCVDNLFSATYLHALAVEFVQQNRANTAFEAPAFDEQTVLNLSSYNELNSTDDALRFIGILDSQKESFQALSVVDILQRKIELAVLPEFRRRGFGAAILQTLKERLGIEFAEFTIWAHGDLPGSAELACKAQLKVYRRLLVLERDLTCIRYGAQMPGVLDKTWTLGNPEKFTLRQINIENSEELTALVKLNQAAFRDHPEQGKLQLKDFQERFAQSWFNPQLLFGVFLGSNLAAYLWLKPESREELELYVLGINSDYQGKGLGKQLTEFALHVAIKENYTRMVLYVDADNTAATATYTKSGFIQRERHFAYQLA